MSDRCGSSGGVSNEEMREAAGELGAAAADLRGKVSPEGLRGTSIWLVLVLAGALLDEVLSLDPDAQAVLFDLVRDRLSWLLTLPGGKLAFEAWRRDR